MPVIKHYKGVCHVYVDAARRPRRWRLRLLLDGKASRPGVCNALETLLVHRDVADAVPARARWPPCGRAESRCAAATRTRALRRHAHPAATDDD